GTVFQWYATGEIDGDDEVALEYAGPEVQYRALTEPLVNLRFNLGEATARGILERDQAAALIAAVKVKPFWQRTAQALWDAPPFRALVPERQAALRAFLEREAIDLKCRDASDALAEVARRQSEPELAPSAPPPTPRAHFRSASHHDRFRLLKRGFPTATGQ